MNKKTNRLITRRRATHNKADYIPPLLSKEEALEIALHIHKRVVHSKESNSNFYFLCIVNNTHNAIILVPRRGTVKVSEHIAWNIRQDWLNIN